jgi:hypothetical protein
MMPRLAVFALLLALLSPALCQLPDAPAPAHTIADRQGYAGDEACRACHQAEFASYLTTAHHVASRPASQASIKGSFAPGANVLHTSNPYLYFLMNAVGESFSQTAIVSLPPAETIVHTEPFNVVIGSGRKGQTYLYWKGEELFELPVSYWTDTNQWMNSPGYADGLPNFDKPIIPRCLECHTSYSRSMPLERNHFDPSSLEYGITCERCHGPGQAHVARTQAGKSINPGTPEDIINPARLARDRQIDLCALCHAGPGTPKVASFSFTSGEDLSRYVSLPDLAPDAPADVHGHQVQQLKSSRCYISSGMTCATCHNVHTPQRDLASFSERCLTCHKAEDCGRHVSMGSSILGNCVNCHMPLRQSNQIVLDTAAGKVRPQVRTHRIAIYPATLP